MSNATMIAKARDYLSDLAFDMNYDSIDSFIDNVIRHIEETYTKGDMVHQLKDRGVRFNSGVSRYVLIPDDAPFVFKFQYQHFGVDYCKRELAMYEDAVERGCGDAFAWCELCGRYGTFHYGVDVYIMQKCDCKTYEGMMDSIRNASYERWKKEKMESACDEDDDSDTSLEAYERSGFYYDCVESDGLIAALQSFYPMAQAIELEQLIDDYEYDDDECGRDIHCGNIGWYNGRLVLVDYAGFGGSFSDSEDYDTWKSEKENPSVNDYVAVCPGETRYVSVCSADLTNINHCTVTWHNTKELLDNFDKAVANLRDCQKTFSGEIELTPEGKALLMGYCEGGMKSG